MRAMQLNPIMRTTVAIADELLVAAKELAKRQGQTLGEVINAALRRELAASSRRTARPAIPAFDGGSGPRPALDLTSNRALHEALDEDTDLDRLR
jgi:hypothetical protein